VSANARRLAIGAVAAVCLLTAPVAAAEKLGWNEKAKFEGKPVMSYTVTSLTFDKTGWSAKVSMRNLSKRTIKVGNEFGVGFWTNGKATDLTQAVGLATATKFSTRPPTSLKPGQSWSGTIGGDGKLNRQNVIYARVIFGPFADFPGQSAPVVWITDHSTALGAKATTKPTAPIPGPAI
jgi:hypothetical protein